MYPIALLSFSYNQYFHISRSILTIVIQKKRSIMQIFKPFVIWDIAETPSHEPSSTHNVGDHSDSPLLLWMHIEKT